MLLPQEFPLDWHLIPVFSAQLSIIDCQFSPVAQLRRRGGQIERQCSLFISKIKFKLSITITSTGNEENP